MYAADNYARFRTQPHGAPPPASGGGGGPASAPPNMTSMGPPSTGGRPRGAPSGGRGAAIPSEIPPEELVKSLQPINANDGRYVGGRRGDPSTQTQMQMQMQMQAAMERRRNAAMGQAPRGQVGGRAMQQRGGGGGEEDNWSPVNNFESMGGAPERTAPPGGMNGYLPPVKYRRTDEFDEYGDPRSGNGGGGGGGGPMGNYRVPVNSYDLSERDPSAAAFAPQQQQQQGRRPQSQHHFQQQQRAAFQQYAQSSPTPPRTQEEMILLRQRFIEQQQLQQQRYGGPPMDDAVGFRPNGPPPTQVQGSAAPPNGAPSSAAAAWARELEAYDTPRRVHHDIQPQPMGGGGGGSGRGGGGARGEGGGGVGPMTPQAMAQMRMRGQHMAEHMSSPGSRIVTPAAALHSSQRNNRGMARHAVMPGQVPRGMPPAAMANTVRGGGETMGMGMGVEMQQGRPKNMRPSYEQEMEAMAMAAMARTARSQRTPPGGGGRSMGGPMGEQRVVMGGAGGPPPVGFPMQDYEAMAMEREMGDGGAPVHDPRQSRPSSASRSRGQPGRGVSPHPMDAGVLDEPYLVQEDHYAMAPAAPLRATPMMQQQRQTPPVAPHAMPQQPLSLAPAAGAAAPPPARASKKRKEPAGPSKKQQRAEAKEAKTAAASSSKTKTTKSTAKSKSNGGAAGGGGAAAGGAEPKRRCGRKSMNYSSEQKRERNRAAVKKCRQRQALKYEYLKRKAEVLASENRALSEMLVKNVELDDEKRNSLTRGIQMDILLKIKEIFTQSLPKDFVLNADSIWDLNSVLAVSMPSRCYYGIESIKDFWRTSLRMRNKGKIRSFWAWLFRLPPGDRFTEFTIEPFSPTSNLYFINWTTKSSPPLSGSIVIMFGHGHRVTLHVEIFGWLIWRYLLTNTPFPEPPME